MKIILCNVWDNSENRLPEFMDFLESIKRFSIPLEEGEEDKVPRLNSEMKNNPLFLYCMAYTELSTENPCIQWYKFSRFDLELIRYLENNLLEGWFFYVEHIDDRFTQPQYFKVNSVVYMHRDHFYYVEKLIIDKDAIINDLYEKKFDYFA